MHSLPLVVTVKFHSASFGNGSVNGVANVITCPVAYVQLPLSAASTPRSPSAGRQLIAALAVVLKQFSLLARYSQVRLLSEPPHPASTLPSSRIRMATS